MKLSALLGSAGGVLGKRFLLVSYLPTLGCVLFVVVLVWAGAPGSRPDFGRAWQTAARLGVGEVLSLWLAITLLAVACHPLQLRLVRLLEGEWPALCAPVRRLSIRHQKRIRARLITGTVLVGGVPDTAAVNRAGAKEAELNARYAPEEVTPSPTALGNALAALEYYAGRAHELDVVVAWPRLYPLVEGALKDAVDTHRDALDAACRFAVAAAVTAGTSAVLLWRGGPWLLLALVPVLLSRLSYRAAVHTVFAYGTAVDAAVDTHRFVLYDKLRLPAPATPAEERALNRTLCTHWRQRVPLPDGLAYAHPAPETGGQGGTGSG